MLISKEIEERGLVLLSSSSLVAEPLSSQHAGSRHEIM